MTSYLFNDLWEDAQDAAIKRYGPEIIKECPFELNESKTSAELFTAGYLVGARVRFNFHGERVA